MLYGLLAGAWFVSGLTVAFVALCFPELKDAIAATLIFGAL